MRPGFAMRALVLTLAGALTVASCGKLDTVGGHYPGTKLYQPTGGGYHLHYADPPWALPDPTVDYGSVTPVLVVRGVYLGTDLSAKLMAYGLQVDRVGCASPAAVAADERNVATAAGEVVDFSVRDFENSAGDVGSEFGTHDGSGSLKALLPASAQKNIDKYGFTVHARRTYFQATDAAGVCFRLLVLTIYDEDEHELSHMLGSFEPRQQGAVTDGGAADRGAADGAGS
jgi:hypothetical protein